MPKPIMETQVSIGLAMTGAGAAAAGVGMPEPMDADASPQEVAPSQAGAPVAPGEEGGDVKQEAPPLTSEVA